MPSAFALSVLLVSLPFPAAAVGVYEGDPLPPEAIAQYKADYVTGSHIPLSVTTDAAGESIELEVIDWYMLDDDLVILRAGGQPRVIWLSTEIQRITLPLAPGVTVITVEASADGGGGVTAAIRSPGGDWLRLPPLLNSESLSVPFVLQ